MKNASICLVFISIYIVSLIRTLVKRPSMSNETMLPLSGLFECSIWRNLLMELTLYLLENMVRSVLFKDLGKWYTEGVCEILGCRGEYYRFS